MEIDGYLDLLHPSEIMETKSEKQRLRECWVDWLMKYPWTTFTTLTFKNDTCEDVANHKFMGLIKDLNNSLLGKHYSKTVDHSYFSYAYVLEYQIREVVHYHVLIDKPINFDRLHNYWNKVAGFAFIEQIINIESSIRYVCKYITKGEDVSIYLAKKEYTPKNLPYWWKN
jgi:hypothetical protein